MIIQKDREGLSLFVNKFPILWLHLVYFLVLMCQEVPVLGWLISDELGYFFYTILQLNEGNKIYKLAFLKLDMITVFLFVQMHTKTL